MKDWREAAKDASDLYIKAVMISFHKQPVDSTSAYYTDDNLDEWK